MDAPVQQEEDMAGSDDDQNVFVVTDALGCNPNSLERIRKMTREVSFVLLFCVVCRGFCLLFF